MKPSIGGTFLASHDPEKLMTWFDAIGIPMQRHGDGGSATFTVGEATMVLGVQKAREGAPVPPQGPVEREPYGRQPMMLNLRVDMEATLERLEAMDEEVEGPVEYDGFGRFAWVRTPDGHDVELWQP